MSLNKNYSGAGVKVGFSFYNRFDVGFEYINGNDRLNFYVGSLGLMIYAGYNFISNNNNTKILAGYIKNRVHISNSFLSNIKVSGPLIGILISPKILDNESISLIPGIGFSLALLSASSRSNNFHISSYPDENINIGLEFNVIPKLNDSFYFVLSPAISKSLSSIEAPFVFGFNFGVIFNVAKK